MEHEAYMNEALALAREAAAAGEVPVGCVIVGPDGDVIGRGRNRREENSDATAHAEIEAIREACQSLGDWRLEGCRLYVTLEPCPMCAGAIINARVPALLFAPPGPTLLAFAEQRLSPDDAHAHRLVQRTGTLAGGSVRVSALGGGFGNRADGCETRD